MKRMLLLISSLLISFSFASTIGGYGELHWDMEGEEMDFHRFVLFYGHAWDDEWSFKAEVELEHNMVGGSHGGYLELEQAYVNWFNGTWGWKGGVVLAPVGIINITHEPPTFLSVERPAYHSKIIPTTWFGNGMAFYGMIGDFSLEFTLMEDLKGQSILDCGINDNTGLPESYAGCIRSGRGKGDVSTTTSLTKIMTMAWTGMDGLRVGGSYTMNEAPTDDANNPLDVTLMEINTTYSKNNIHNVFEWATGDFDNGSTSWTSNGYYLDLGYNLGSVIGMEGKTLMPWFRTSSYTLDDSDSANDTDILLYGLTFKPNASVSIKLDMGTTETGGIESNIFNFGVGYMF